MPVHLQTVAVVTWNDLTWTPEALRGPGELQNLRQAISLLTVKVNQTIKSASATTKTIQRGTGGVQEGCKLSSILREAGEEGVTSTLKF